MNDTELDIKTHPVEGTRMVAIHGREVIVKCVDGCEYSRWFKNETAAQDARRLVAILPTLWKKI